MTVKVCLLLLPTILPTNRCELLVYFVIRLETIGVQSIRFLIEKADVRSVLERNGDDRNGDTVSARTLSSTMNGHQRNRRSPWSGGFLFYSPLIAHVKISVCHGRSSVGRFARATASLKG